MRIARYGLMRIGSRLGTQELRNLDTRPAVVHGTDAASGGKNRELELRVQSDETSEEHQEQVVEERWGKSLSTTGRGRRSSGGGIGAESRMNQQPTTTPHGRNPPAETRNQDEEQVEQVKMDDWNTQK